MSTSTNAEIVRRFFDERWNKRNLAVYDELRSKDEGIEDQIAWVQRCLDAWSECTMTMPSLVAQDDQVCPSTLR